MNRVVETNTPITLSPNLYTGDVLADYWLRQVTLRLRREITWLRYERGTNLQTTDANLPPFVDPVQSALNLQRYYDEKQAFFKNDTTAGYLTEQLDADSPSGDRSQERGSFSWLVEQLDLDGLSAFLLALGLVASFDNAIGSVISACLNNPTQTHPTLALAQQLWDRPHQILKVVHPNHPLFNLRLLQLGNQPVYQTLEMDWHKPIMVPSLIANQLLFPDSPLPSGLTLLDLFGNSSESLSSAGHLVAAKLKSSSTFQLQIIPINGPKGAAHVDTIKALAASGGREIVQFTADPNLLKNERYLSVIVALCWLKSVDIILPAGIIAAKKNDHQLPAGIFNLPGAIPLTIYLTITDRDQQAKIPSRYLLPVVNVPDFTYEKRVEYWKQSLGMKARGLDKAIRENARRFRYQKETVASVADTLNSLNRKITPHDFTAACRTELELDIGDLAQKVSPRFQEEKLILPPNQDRQFHEIIRAVRSLTKVHYEWGTAKVWNEAGIAVLFAGPPGTGKTMGAEVLAIELDLPMYRIDLSQVVNKYIGETEKNLKRLFDAADVSDIILFFDEADSLFGQRSEVKDAHDRYANLEISYLLERMERFKGLAILASNRKKDLDEAFLRRLRYIIDFPLPSETQRRLIWQQVIPDVVDSSDVDFEFLAKNFRLAGGHIRSIVFNACLQSANGSGLKNNLGEHLEMEAIIASLKREYDKLNRPINIEAFGPYAEIVKELDYVKEVH